MPAIMARMPIRDRSLRRAGAIPPIPPIWIAIELKFANPHSAYVAMMTERGERSEPLPSAVLS